MKESKASNFDFGSLLKVTASITFTPKYNGNELYPLNQTFSLSSTEKECQRVALGMTYNCFVDRSTQLIFDEIGDEEFFTKDAIKALITSDSSKYSSSDLTKVRDRVINTDGLYQKFYDAKLEFKRRIVYSKAYSMLVNRTSNNSINFVDFFNPEINRIPYPLIFILSMFYDSEQSMIQVPEFNYNMLDSIDITDS